MESFRNFIELEEKRKNPEQNPKVGAFYRLYPYMKKSGFYMTFTDLKKVGVNPMTPFNTPVGIYTYPIKETRDSWHNGKFEEFGGNRPYIHVLQRTTNNVIADLSRYSKSSYLKDIGVLRKLANVAIKPNMSVIKHLKSKLSELQDQYRKKDTESAAYMKRSLDDPLSLTDNEAANWRTLNIELRDLAPMIDDLQDQIMIQEDGYERIKDGIERKYSHYGQRIWELTRWVANSGKDPSINVAANAPMRWNVLFRKLGYKGVGDLSGKGWIHPAEKRQFVFFEKSAFKVVEMINNIAPQSTSKQKIENIKFMKAMNKG